MNPHVTILGAGLSGALMSIFLARNARKVVLYERRPDLRKVDMDAGRSINLALAARGIEALKEAGVFEEVEPLLILMRGRMLHALDGQQSFVLYGQRPHEVIFSVSRPGLNGVLLNHAQRVYGISPKFLHAARAIDFDRDELTMLNEVTGDPQRLRMAPLIAADGAGSIVRRAMTGQLGVRVTEDMLEHGYEELTLPASATGTHRVEKHALHIWPRGGFMLIALPNLDGSFTVTLFLPLRGSDSFATLDGRDAVDDFFRRHFPDAVPLMPNVAREFLENPIGRMGTVYCDHWAARDKAVLLGDAAHAMVPFHGQGMNCAFEDCVALARHIDEADDWARAFAGFEGERRPNAEAIQQMALENYIEMRDQVDDADFLLRRQLERVLAERHPGRFVPRYSMVTFLRVPYLLARIRGEIQRGILMECCEG